jgi:2,3-bisphosphoglycerate-dependent phosphoglycerate mutase
VDISVVFETHSISEDNERGIATGWLPGRLSAQGRSLARQLGERRRDDGIAAVFSSDLRRAMETVSIAFESDLPVFYDWRLRECDYGKLNGTPADHLHAQMATYLDVAHPGGESWHQAVTRVGRFLADLPLRWAGRRVLIVGHMATRWGLDHFLNGLSLDALAATPFRWQEGWEYLLK